MERVTGVGRRPARRPLRVHGARPQSGGRAAARAQRLVRRRVHAGRSCVARRSVPRGHRPDRRVDQHGRPAGGGGRLSRDLRQAHQRALRRKGAGDLAVRPAGVLLQPADQDARRSQDAAGALVHAVDVEADRSARRDAGVDPVPGSLSVAAARRRELRRDLADLGEHRPLAGSHLASAAALGVRLDPGASGQRRLVGEAQSAAAGGDDAGIAPDGEGSLGAGAHRQRGRDQLQHRQGALRAEAAHQIHHDAC